MVFGQPDHVVAGLFGQGYNADEIAEYVFGCCASAAAAGEELNPQGSRLLLL